MKKHLYLVLIFCLLCQITFSQSQRISLISEKLTELAQTSKGLNETVNYASSGASIQEFLRAIAEIHKLNIIVDSSIDIKLYFNFKGETVLNVLIFIADKYDLDIKTSSSIISISPNLVNNTFIQRKIPLINYDEANKLFNVDLKNDTLIDIVNTFIRLTGENIVVSLPIQKKLVSSFSSESTLLQVLEKLAFSNNLKLITSGKNYILEDLLPGEKLVSDGVYTSSISSLKKSYRDILPAQSVAGLQLGVQLSATGEQLISIQANNTAISDIIRAISIEANVSYFIYNEIKGNITVNIETRQIDDIFNTLLKGTEYTFKKENGVYLIGERKLEGLRSSKVVQLKNRAIDSLIFIIPSEIKKGVEIKEFKELNSILLTGSLPQIVEIESFLMALDKIVPLITIEVIIVDIKKSKTIRTGITAGVSDSIRTGGTLLPGLDYTFGARSINDFLEKFGNATSINLGKVTPNFYVNLSALEANQNVEIRQTPKLSTLNGHVANLSIGSTRFYTVTTQNVVGSLNPQTIVTEQFIPIEANLSINIRPIVSGDDQVTLNIEVKISDFIGNPPMDAPPPSSNSNFKSIIRVKNEEMIVLGGIERTENGRSSSGVPFLSRIPIIKWLFSNKEKTDSKIVSVVFIKPVITY